MNDWAKDAVERLKHKEETTRDERERLSREYRIKQGQGRILFAEIGDSVREGIKAININYGSDALKSPVTPAAEIKVIAELESGQRQLKATHDETMYRIHYQIATTQGVAKEDTFTMRIARDGNAVFVDTSGKEMNPAAIGQQMLIDLLA